MAEGSSNKGFARVFSRKVTRTKEKVFQSIGKSDKTKDEVFDEHVNNLAKQSATAAKLQKELKSYISSVKAMSLSSKAYYECMKEAYDCDWIGYTELVSSIEQLNSLWGDYVENLQDSLLLKLQEYIAKFPDMKNKINKRGRKLVDYDSARHALMSLQNSKKQDQTKVYKAQEDMNEAKRIYEDFNTELHRDLPAFYESRISFLASHYNELFTIEARFQEESARLKSKLMDVTDNLLRDHEGEGQRGPLHLQMQASNLRPPTQSVSKDSRGSSHRKESDSDEDNEVQEMNGVQMENTQGRSTFYAIHSSGNNSEENEQEQEDEEDEIEVFEESDKSIEREVQDVFDGVLLVEEAHSPIHSPKDIRSSLASSVHETSQAQSDDAPSSFREEAVATAAVDSAKDSSDEEKEEEAHPVEKVTPAVNSDVKDQDAFVHSLAEESEDIYQVPKSNEPVPVAAATPSTVIFQVLATHPYNGEDVDELTFETGDLIDVIPFEDPEDQDDGWLMGIKCGTKDKGVFPENFTKRLGAGLPN
ncbi:hypothetical protein CAPTEDRAFT_222018 [Capitella teleta]|uniref:SH3 domain-containing protein n=1 Tax=Capitella teleta TaxID=283909 RepID=R7UEP5_CAPTE|nr:hypothetical protein CAPTEDRAFT_222018 [Capitella teleta]|eukprot:ELU01752.1 hypothetical protein CAPTEDRAFT_222018 [Capitella teleta]